MPNTYLKKYLTVQENLIRNIKVNSIVSIYKSLAKTSKKNKVFVFGNGGSAAVASHFALDLTNNSHIKCLTFSDMPMMTCLSNDYGYENFISKYLDMYGDKGDVLILISSSGNSKNVVNAYKKAHKLKFRDIFTFTGFNKNSSLSRISKNNIWIDSKNYNQVENLHQICLLSIVDLFKKYKK